MTALLLLTLGALLTLLEMTREPGDGPPGLLDRALAASGPAAILYLGSAVALSSLALGQALAMGALGVLMAVLALRSPHRQPLEKC